MKIQLAQAATGVFDGFRLAAMWHEQEIAQNIQSNTLTTGAGQNSLALGEVHQDSGQTVYDFLSRDLEGVVNTQIIARLCAINIADFDPTLCPRLVLGNDENADRLNLAKMFDLLIKDGVVWKRAKFVREELGLPPMDEDEQQQLDLEAKAQQEAQKQLADARNSGKTKALGPQDSARALDILTRAITAQMQQENNAA